MALGIDGQAHNNANPGSSITVTLTTTKSNDLVVVFMLANGGPLTSVTSANLSFTKRATAGSGTTDFEYWYAVAANPLSSEVITVTQTTSNFLTVEAYAISGADTVTKFDGSPVTATGFGTSDPLTISTTADNTMIIGGFRFQSQNLPTQGTGFTIISGADFSLQEYKIVTSPQTNLSVTVGTGAGDANGGIADAILMAPDLLMAQIIL